MIVFDSTFRHSFKIVQMPANLLEITGLATAPSMQKAGLKVAFSFVCLIVSIRKGLQ